MNIQQKKKANKERLEFYHDEKNFFKAINWDRVVSNIDFEKLEEALRDESSRKKAYNIFATSPINVLTRLTSATLVLYLSGPKGRSFMIDLFYERVLSGLIKKIYGTDEVKKSVIVEHLEDVLFDIRKSLNNDTLFRKFLSNLYNETVLKITLNSFELAKDDINDGGKLIEPDDVNIH